MSPFLKEFGGSAKGLPGWLSSAVFYQVYPASFYDGNGDGIGDLGGIIEKLDYIESLGCNAIWVNPCFESPFRDGGYDISDYYKVARRYGTNRDLLRLFREAEKRQIKVCLDLVAGHTSIDHPWFEASSSGTKNKYSNYYIWSNHWNEETDPDLHMVKGYGERNGQYAANFFWSQPALNYGFARCDADKDWQLPVDHRDCRRVKREMLDVIRYWLDQGAAGYRVDMAGSLVKNDKGAKATSRIWQEVREHLNTYYPQAVLISEWGYPADAIRAGFHVDFLLPWNTPGYRSLFRMEPNRNSDQRETEGHSFFDKAGQGDILTFLKSYLFHSKKTKRRGYIAIPTGNHDMGRISQGRSQKEIELVFAFILTMPGVPFIYYGDEIGMKTIKNLPSKEGGYTRTGSRTPMQWTPGRNAGFSKASSKKLYLPIDRAQNFPNVKSQLSHPNSLLNKVRALIALRRDNPALGGDGEFEPLYAKREHYPFVYSRRFQEQCFVIAINPSDEAITVELGSEQLGHDAELVFGSAELLPLGTKHTQLSMGPISYAVFRQW